MAVLYAFPRVKVYIFGKNVTADVQRVKLGRRDDGKLAGTVEITLASPNGRYNLSDVDVANFAIKAGQLSVEEAADVARAINLDRTGAVESAAARAQTVLGTLPDQPTEEEIADFKRLAAQAQKDYYAVKNALRRRTEVLGRAIATLDDQIRSRLEQEIADPVKRQILLAKFAVRQRVRQPPVISAGSLEQRLAQSDRSAYLELVGEAPRYPFYAGGSIFHPNDPVTVCVRDPFEPTTWYWGFRGKISDRAKTIGVDNDQRVTIVAQDLRRDLMYARVATNPGILDISAVGEAEDFVLRTFANESFSDLTLEEYVFSILFGPGAIGAVDRIRGLGAADRARLTDPEPLTIERRNADGVVHRQEVQRYGVGALRLEDSRTVIFGPPSDAPSTDPTVPRLAILDDLEQRIDGDLALETYQTLVDPVVRFADVYDMRLPDTGTPNPTSILDVMDEIGENPQYYPVDAGRLIMLSPASLGPDTNRNVLSRDIVQGIPTQTTFRSRLELLYQVIDRLEFRLDVTPKGDLVIEMPLCDFAPSDFGLYKDRYTLTPIETSSSSTTENDDRVRTQARAHYNVVPNYSLAKSGDIGRPIVETLRGLVPQYGYRLEDVDPPVYLANEQAARLYAQIRLNIINAEAITSQIEMAPNVAWTPNRPIEWRKEARILTTRSIDITFDWTGQGSATASVGLNYTRVWDGRLDDTGRRLYTAIGGVPGKPFDYAALFNRRRAKPASGG